MQQVWKFDQKQSISTHVNDMEKISEVGQRIKNKHRIFLFYNNLLKYSRYKKLYPYVFYFIALFYPDKMKEKYLLKSLQSSLTYQDKEFALSNLYQHYKSKSPEPAIGYLKKIIKIQLENKNYSDLENNFHWLANHYNDNRDFFSALHFYFESLRYSKFNRKNQYGDTYLNIAEIFNLINRNELAKKYLKKALDNAIKNKNDFLKIQVFNAYSKIYYYQKNFTKALKCIDLSLKTEAKINMYVSKMDSLYRKSLILMKTGNTEKAMSFLETAIETGLNEKKYHTILPIISEYIEVLIKSNRLTPAYYYLGKIDEIFAPYYRYYFFYYFSKALLFEKEGNLEYSVKYYQKAITKLNDFFSKLADARYYAYREKIETIYAKTTECYLKMFDKTGNRDYLEKALFYSEIRNSFNYELMTIKRKQYYHLTEEKEKLQQEFSICYKKLNEALKKDSENTKKHYYENKIISLKKQYAELMEYMLELKTSFKKYRLKDFSLSRIQKTLKPNQLLIKFTVVKESIYIFFIDYLSAGYMKLINTTDNIIQKITALTKPLDEFTKGNVDYLRINYNLDLANQLYNLLLSRILTDRQDKNELFIIPDKDLFKIPFEALVTGFNAQKLDPEVIFSEYQTANYLIGNFSISYYISLLHIMKRIPSSPKIYQVAAFGSPEIKREKNKTMNVMDINLKLFHEIPSSKRELLNIRKIFGKKKCRIFSDQAFNRINFESHAPQADIVHIATHFFNNTQYPYYSSLLFSSSDNHSPFYYAHEIQKLKLNSKLVVLSTCESSEKHLMGLKGLRGMTASFRYTGVKSLIVSMWPVDEFSSSLIPIFYSDYRETNSIPTALRNAKLKFMRKIKIMRHNLKISFAHPFLWANYIHYIF